ncbi:MAG: hypothetical protein IPG91_02025 [Ideonella sp.]|nr:hypothetical protein [Ideonella sp.]
MLATAAGAAEPSEHEVESSVAAAPVPVPVPVSVPVLLQLSLTVDGKPRDALAALKLYSARLDSTDPPVLLSPTVVGAAGGEAAVWVRLALEPGSHFLLVLPPGLDQNPPAVAYHAPSARFGRLVRHGPESLRGATRAAPQSFFVYAAAAPHSFEPLEGFLLRVPPDAASVYGGTLSIACTGGADESHDLIRVCSDISVSDRRTELPSVAPGEAAQQFSPVTPYDMPLVALDLRGEGLITGVVPKAFAVTAANRQPAPAPMPPYVAAPGPAAAVFNLLMLGGKLGADAANSRAAAAQAEAWRPCLAELATEPAAEEFGNAVREGAGRACRRPGEADRGRGPVPTQADQIDFNIAVEFAPQQLQVVACRDAEHFCLEMAMRVAVIDLAGKRQMFDAVILYVNDLTADDPGLVSRRLLQLRADERPVAKTQDAWCGKDRLQQFGTEIGRASEAIVRSALRHMQGPW